jgi:flavin reductase (DIM6/NTAB) family NADH-FMN oxidoreductase RutF
MTMSWHMIGRVRSTADCLRGQQSQFQLRSLEDKPRVHNSASGHQAGTPSGANWKLLRTRCSEIRKVPPNPPPAAHVAPPLVKECNLECKVTDTRLVNTYNLFILEVLKAWIDPAQKHRRTIHHHGNGRFAVDGPMIKLTSKMR